MVEELSSYLVTIIDHSSYDIPDGVELHLYGLIVSELWNQGQLTNLGSCPSKLKHHSKAGVIQHLVINWSSRAAKTLMPHEEERDSH